MRKNILIAILILTAAPALFAAGPANSPANPNNITASVAVVCRIATFSVDFSAGGTVSYDPVNGATLTASTPLNVFCTKGGAPTTLTLNTGANAVSAPAPSTRAMKNGTSFLGYDLYVDNAYSTNWTAGLAAFDNSTSNATAITSSGAAINIYGRIPASQDVPAGAYNDTVVATVNF